MLNASDAFQMDGGKLFKEDEDLGDIFFDTVSFVEIVKPRKPEISGSGVSFWKRDPVGTFEWYFKSHKESLKYCDFVIYGRSQSRNNCLKPCYTTKGGHCIPQKSAVYQAVE